MPATPADLSYATYMLKWIETLDWPDLAIAAETLPALRAYWTESADVDLDAISDRLWAWVDANGGAQPSADQRMILVRMLICLAANPNRELESVGFFEDLLDGYGVAPDDVLRSKARAPVGEFVAAVPTASIAPRTSAYQQQKSVVLLAFAVVSFVSGAHPMVAMAAQTARAIELGLVFAMVSLMFLWYRIDAEERGFQRSLWLNIGIVMLAAVAMPYYLIRSRGWEQGQLSVLKLISVFLGSIILSAIGARLFGHVA